MKLELLVIDQKLIDIQSILSHNGLLTNLWARKIINLYRFVLQG